MAYFPTQLINVHKWVYSLIEQKKILCQDYDRKGCYSLFFLASHEKISKNRNSKKGQITLSFLQIVDIQVQNDHGASAG